jgi:diguanylate cyclase (GGDEF)-like protein
MKFGLSGWQLNTVEEALCWHKVKRRQIQAINEVTGPANYPGHSETVESEIKRSKRSGRDFALLVFDLNGIKQINNRHDHLARDRALCRVAHILRSSCRIIDTTVRYCDDKIAIILPDSGAEAADLVQRRICERVSIDAEKPLLSVSVGTAVYPSDGKTVDTLFRVAVRALHEKKERVEDAVMTHSEFLPFVISKQKRVSGLPEGDPLTYANVKSMTE